MFLVEGSIGAGKSTFLQLLERAISNLSIMQEPVNHWTGSTGQSLLTNFYENPHRWAYTLETFAMACRVHEHLKEQKNFNPYRITERSIYSGHYVFAYNSYQQGFLSDLEWQLYSAWFDLWTRPCTMPLGFIYLRVEPEIAYERIKKRNRPAEKNITLDYVNQIHERHENFLIERFCAPEIAKIPVLTIDGNQDFEDNTSLFAHHVQQVQAFMEAQIERFLLKKNDTLNASHYA